MLNKLYRSVKENNIRESHVVHELHKQSNESIIFEAIQAGRLSLFASVERRSQTKKKANVP